MSETNPDAAPAALDEGPAPQPVLRTLAPLLRGLEKQLRTWLDSRHKFPLSMLQRAELEGLADDLRRQGDTLDVEKPLLVVMLMGGTGVGKSTLLNALAGGPIAQASFTRPTTRDPVVYFHHSVKSDRLDPALRVCRLVQHDRAGLEQKVIVDTPDIDSNDLSNRDKLLALLPVADIVLYVGSQEKYHDRLGWELFKAQRQRRAFAFVLNKWDRCVTGESGLRPDEDLLNDLKAEGFEKPLLFRTTAQLWLEAAQKYTGSGPLPKPADLPEGEQFALLRNWLELGITRLEIEAVKARGVGQLLTQIARTAEDVRPPDLTAEGEKVKAAWEKTLAEEADVQADVLVGTLEPYQTEVEHHFSVEDQARFRGLMAAYMRLTTRLRYASSGLRDRIPFGGLKGRLLGSKVETPVEWNLGAFVQECARTAGERVLDQRTTALINRLLVEGDTKGFPLALLSDPTNAVARLDWRDRMTRAVIDALAEVERRATHPTGWRKVLRGTLSLLANTLPETALVATAGYLLWNFFVRNEVPDLFRLSLVALIPLLVVIVFHMLIALLLPVRWPAIRSEFRAQLGDRMAAELSRAYLAIPGEVAAAVREERKQVDALVAETKQVSDWLAERQQAARVAELYGK
ncbi:MAG: 50S ribosome-binding GTPase [Planctomycetes bacterium]|nr:50S ribosome-binding GTPase [Planctomycetota bacterium]